MSKAKEISIALSERLGAISVANGYLTDIGVRVFRGRRKIDESQVPCSVIVEGDDTVGSENRTQIVLGQQYFIEGHAPCDPDNPNDVAHDIITDIKRAVFGPGPQVTAAVRKIEYKGRAINPRDDGAALISASIEVSIQFVEEKDAP